MHSTVPGSPAAADTQIHQGDLLEQVRGGRRRSAAGGVRSEATSALSLIPAHAVGCCLRSSPPVHLQVDKHNVFRFPMKQVAGMLLGPSGTLVALTFQRRPADGQPFLRVHTVLRRVDVRALRISQPQDEVCMCVRRTACLARPASYCLSCTAWLRASPAASKTHMRNDSRPSDKFSPALPRRRERPVLRPWGSSSSSSNRINSGPHSLRLALQVMRLPCSAVTLSCRPCSAAVRMVDYVQITDMFRLLTLQCVAFMWRAAGQASH